MSLGFVLLCMPKICFIHMSNAILFVESIESILFYTTNDDTFRLWSQYVLCSTVQIFINVSPTHLNMTTKHKRLGKGNWKDGTHPFEHPPLMHH